MIDPEFARWFSSLTDPPLAPHAWQAELAADDVVRSRVVRIPTGMGKTLGVFAAWAWHRLERRDEAWPRRLVWCLPMRTLVEQTHETVATALSRLGLLWSGSGEHGGKAGVHLLMGGTDAGGDWHVYPEEAAVLVGTQDMLLSRALNRGYGAARARWPFEFGLLSHDALWVVDEAQLMDVGLATTAQLQAYHDQDAATGFRPRHTWWMSATLQPSWLKSVDTSVRHGSWIRDPVRIPAALRKAALGDDPKALGREEIPASDHEGFAQLVLSEHRRLQPGQYGRITLVVCNLVERARQTFEAIQRMAPSEAVEVELVHSRFRPHERTKWRERFLSRQACGWGADRIIVATQVVEAGVDISAGCVVSDLAPWSSLVQRFGRCARYGGSGRCVVVDRGSDEPAAVPYQVEELKAADWALDEIGRLGLDVGLASLEVFEDGLDDAARQRLYPYSPDHLLLREEFDELFDTTPDLTGADLDISRFIRRSDDRDLQVFWRDLPGPTPAGRRSAPPASCRPQHEELCAVPFLAARDWLCGEKKEKQHGPPRKLRAGVRAWVWDWIEGEWVEADRAALRPGQVVCVAADVGGYDLAAGFSPESAAPVLPVPLSLAVGDHALAELGDEANDVDGASVAQWKTIASHGAEVATLARQLGDAVQLPAPLVGLLDLAAVWHDLGKAHPAFQGAVRHEDRPARQDVAKAPDSAWLRPRGTYRTSDNGDERPGFRHELASVLALFSVLLRHRPGHEALLGPWLDILSRLGVPGPAEPGGGTPTPAERRVVECSAEAFDLLAYLVASHHGKVRVALHAGPKDQLYAADKDGRGLPIRGVREGDRLASVQLIPGAEAVPEVVLTLEPAAMGLSPRTGRSWRERTLALQQRFGPGALAWLEGILMAADRRASRLPTPDPLLAEREASR